jgi:hypothetical protein
MKRNNVVFWIAGWAGLAGGALLALIGVVSTDELSQFAGGYGLMTMGAAVYLLGGLGLRDALGRRRSRSVVTAGAHTMSTASISTQRS